MNFKGLFLSAVMALGATGASAATLNNVERVIGGPTITGDGTLILFPEVSTPGFVTPASAVFSGFGASTNATGPLQLTINLLPDASFLSFEVFGEFLVGGPTSGQLSDGPEIIRALFRTISGSAEPDFGSLFVLELTGAGIFDGILDASSLLSVEDVEATVYAVTEIAPIPLPAGVWLLLGGFGTLVAIRRRQTV